MSEVPPTGFVERHSSWTGRAWLEIDGPGARVPVGPGYAAERRRLQAAFPLRPWTADWSDGTFPPAPGGVPAYPALLASGVALAAAVVAAGRAGVGPAVAVAVAGLWPALRLLDHASITPAGIRLGPPWALRVGWGEVERVGLHVADGRARLWAITRYGGGVVDVPPVLAPAVRARLRRRSGLPVESTDGGLDLRYARWRPAAAGIPLGALAGALVGAPLAADPFGVLFVGGLVAAALGALDGAVTARATGWGVGAVAWSTVAFGVALAALAIGSR